MIGRLVLGHGGLCGDLDMRPICPVCKDPKKAHVTQRKADVYACGYCGIVFDVQQKILKETR